MRDSNLFDLLLWVMRLRRRVRVTGASMFPLLQAGDEVLVDMRAFRRHPPRVGDVVVVRHPHRAELKMVKRVTAVFPDNQYHVTGDNPAASTDSRDFGAVTLEHILGRVTSRFGPSVKSAQEH